MIVFRQASVSAYPVVNEDNVYSCTGDVMPRDITTVTTALLNSPFNDTFTMLREMTADKGYALSDLLTSIADQIMRMQLPPAIYMGILKKLSDVE